MLSLEGPNKYLTVIGERTCRPQSCGMRSIEVNATLQ